jgi:hypothetical protein
LPDPRGLYAGLSAFLIICVNAGCATISCSPLATHIAHHPELCANVSVIFVDATPDLGNWGRLPELTNYFHCSGVESFYFHPNVHGGEQCLASWIYHEKVQRGRQVILVGWSYGMVDSLDALRILEKQSVRVDTLISIDCFCLNFHRGCHLQPSNADRVVLVYRESAALPEGFHHPAVYRVETCNHLKMPGHSATVNTLFRETLRLGQIQAYGKSAHPPVRIPINGPVCGNGEPQGGFAVQQVSHPLQLR